MILHDQAQCKGLQREAELPKWLKVKMLHDCYNDIRNDMSYCELSAKEQEIMHLLEQYAREFYNVILAFKELFVMHMTTRVGDLQSPNDAVFTL